MSIYEDFMKKDPPVVSQTTPVASVAIPVHPMQSPQIPSTGGTIFEKFMAQQPPQEDKLMGALGSIGDVLKQPAAAAMDVISYFDKPRGAIAGAVKALQDQTPVMEGAKKGWEENTSWKETFNPQWVKENPMTAAGLGLAADVVVDPLNIITPAKIASMAGKGAKAIGLTSAINPIVKAVEESNIGKRAIAAGEDIVGVNRLADAQSEFKAARAADQVLGQDVIDEINNFKKANPAADAADITKFVEAMPRENIPVKPINIPDLQIKKPVNEMQEYFDLMAKSDNVPVETVLNDHVNKWNEVLRDTVSEMRSSEQKGSSGVFYNDFTGKNERVIKSKNENPVVQSFVTKNGRYPKADEWQRLAEDYVLRDNPEAMNIYRNAQDAKEYLDTIKAATPKIAKNIPVEQEEAAALLKAVRSGAIPKQSAFDTLRESGKEIPDFLLQEHQRVAKSAKQDIPDYIYRDQVLAAIPDPAVRSQVERIGNMIADKNIQLSDELLKTGRLSPEQVVRFQEGSHLRRSFEKYENPEKFLEDVKKHGTPEEWQRAYADYQTTQATGTGFGGSHKVNMKDFTGRQVLSEDTLKAMKVIDEPAYRVMDTFNRGSKALREDEFLGKVSQLYGVDEKTAAAASRDLPASRQFVPVPDSKSYGALAGKWIPADVAKQVMGTLGQKPDEINKTFGKILSWWKVEKLANPASIMRNLYSGIPMANVFGRVPLAAMPKYMKRVSTAFLTGGKNDPLIREIRSSGALGNVWSKQELSNIIGDRPKGLAKIADVGMQAFGAPDVFSRAVVYAYHRDHGMTAKQATKFADKAQFDYSQAPEWVNWLSKTGAMPFAKFPFFAGKATAEALYKNPAEVTKYIKAQNQVNNKDRDTIMPDYLKAKTLLPVGESTRMVNGKPQKIQQNVDLSYILPFSNDVRLGNPVTDAMIMAATGKNAIGQQVIKPGMTTGEKAKEWGSYAYNALGPAIPLPGNYAGNRLYDAATGRVDTKGRQYDLPSAAMQTFLGIKNVPINEQELAKQKITTLTMQQRDIAAMVSQIAKDQSLTTAQKQERIADHKRQLQELGKEIRGVNEAWQRIKAKQ